MQKFTLTILFLFFSITVFSQNDTLSKMSLADQWIKNRVIVYMGTTYTDYNPVPFYYQNPSHKLGWEIGVKYKILGDDGVDIVFGFSRSFYSYQSERAHKDILHVVRHMAYQNSVPLYFRYRLSHTSPFHLDAGFRLAIWSYYYYTYDIYQNAQSAQLIYHQQSRVVRRRNSPRFISFLYLHFDLEYRLYKNLGMYISADLSKQSHIGLGLTWAL